MKEILELTQTLTRVMSTKDNQKEREKCLEIIKEYLGDVTFEEISGESPVTGQKITSLYAHKGNPEVLLIGHIDVVDADKKQFEPYVEGDWLYGRGTGDMKAGVAIACKLLKEHDNCAVLFTGDEEIGGGAGAALAVKQINPKFAIALEPSWEEIRTKEKGGLWIEIHAQGKGGHASEPWRETSAIDALLSVYSLVREKYPIPAEEEWVSTCNIGGIIGGNVQGDSLGPANAIAKTARMKLDFRLTEHETIKDVLLFLRDVLGEVSPKTGCVLELHEPETMVEHLFTEANNPYVEKLDAAFVKTQENNPVIGYGHAASDTRFFSAKGIGAVVFGPDVQGHHSTSERVRISSLKLVYEVLDAFLKQLQ